MTHNCLLLDNQSETFLVKILIYKNRMVKRILREDKERNPEETQDCLRSISSILDLRHSEQPSDFTKSQSQTLETLIILTAPHRYSSSRYFFFFFPGKQTLFTCYLLSHKRVSIKKTFLLFVNGFPLFFELLDNLATHITCPSEEDPAELCPPHPFVDLSNTVWARKDLTKQTVGSKCGSHEHNSHKYCD